MLKEFVKTILDLKRPETIDINKCIYALEGYKPVKEPTCSTLTAHTLTGINDYIINNIDESRVRRSLVIHISDYDHVSLITALFGDWKQREALIEASAFGHKDTNGRWMDVENFIITLNAEFVRTEDSAYLARVTSGITDAASKEIKDNGITQTAAIKSGISLIDNVEIKNPVTLKPYRTFPEIEQPDIQFVFRVRKGHNGPECALFEADGGLWKIETIQKIKAWFEQKLGKDSPISIIA